MARIAHRPLARIAERWRNASLKASFAACVAAWLVVALVASTSSAALFAHLQNAVTEDFSEVSGLYLFDSSTSTLRQARTVWATSDDLGAQREVFVESARNEYAAIELSELPDGLAISDATDYPFLGGVHVSGAGEEEGVSLSWKVENAVDDLLSSELDAASLPGYDARARAVAEEAAKSYADDPSLDLAELGGGLAVSPVGYYLYEPPSLGARVMSGTFGTLAFLMFPLWFGVCIAAAARRFHNRRLKPAIELLDGAASKIASENLDFSLSYPRSDEMGRLVTSFETMRSSLAASQRALWRTVEERKRLNAAFAHDLRTPLTVLHGTVEMMSARADAGSEDPGRLAADCAALARQIERIERYVEAMAGIQRLEDRAVAPTPVPIPELVADLGAVGRALCVRAGVAFEMGGSHADGGDGAIVSVDRGIASEVAENLVGNAARHAAAKVCMHLTVEMLRPSGPEDAGAPGPAQLVLVVSDDGPGFSPRALRDGCLPFFSEDKSAGGFGLGLSIARLLCEKHGGSLELANGDGGGARVTARLAV